MISIEEMATFCKKKGFVFPTAEIYGGLSGFFDYGPLGVELKNNIKAHWWKRFVKNRRDVVGIDGSTITNPKVWKASGHIDSFDDVLVEDTKTHERYRADHLVEDALNIAADGLSAEDLWKLIKENKIISPKGNDLSPPKQFNLMFHTRIGPTENEKAIAYLRPETAQNIFINFKLVQESSRLKLPFGIAQIGKGYRNEISPRDFLFRVRELEMMELEFFIDPEMKKFSLLTKDHKNTSFLFLSEADQEKKSKGSKKTIADLIKSKKLNEVHAYWLSEAYQWFIDLGVNEKNLRIREHVSDELSHYSKGTYDIEYKFPFGWKEIHGNANRGVFDLTKHQEHSKSKLTFFDEASKKHILPAVIEPSWGIDRAFLVLLFDAYNDDKKRGNVVLKLHPQIAPIQVGVFPLVKNKEPVVKKAHSIFSELQKHFTTQYDESGSIGRRYARADEMGIPYCLTIDFDSLDDDSVTVRHRNTTKQERVKVSDLVDFLGSRLLL